VRVIGGAGADTLVAGGGGMHFDGGAGFDILRFRDEAPAVVIDLQEPAGDGLVALRIEEFQLGGGDDVFRGGARADRLDGGDGNDTLVGRVGNDMLDGNLGDDLVQGGEGADSLIGSEGGDVLEGGAGADTLDGGRGGDRLDGGEGFDTATFAPMLDFEILQFIGVAIDLDLPEDNLGEALGDTYVGIERFVLTALDDVFYGDDSAQFVLGGQGDDWIVGRGGRDRLSGGGGSDGFGFGQARDGRDIITDFTRAEGERDWIWVDASGFGGGLVTGMDLAAGDRFVAGIAPVASQAEGQFLYDTATGLLSWDVDGTGRASPFGFALLQGAPTLTAADIVVL
jgi:Ca2+-binding RTX toxin-like protein